MPSHTSSVVAAYPELAPKGRSSAVSAEFGVRDPTLDPSKEATWHFARAILKEVASVFPDQYVHLGGDEVVTKWWENDAGVEAWTKSERVKDGGSAEGGWDVSEVQPHISQELASILLRLNRTMVGWDEILGRDGGTQLVRSTDLRQNNRTRFRPVIQSWQGEDGMFSVRARAVPVGPRALGCPKRRPVCSGRQTSSCPGSVGHARPCGAEALTRPGCAAVRQGVMAGLFTLRSHGYYLDHLQPTKNHYGVYVIPPGMRDDESGAPTGIPLGTTTASRRQSPPLPPPVQLFPVSWCLLGCASGGRGALNWVVTAPCACKVNTARV